MGIRVKGRGLDFVGDFGSGVGVQVPGFREWG